MTTKRVLLVEDDKAIARLILDNLRFEGFSVEWCESGRDVVGVAARFAPDLVLLDLMLPGGPDGLDLCRTFTQAAERTPVIIITARAEKEDRVRGLTLGADDYVVKPFARPRRCLSDSHAYRLDGVVDGWRVDRIAVVEATRRAPNYACRDRRTMLDRLTQISGGGTWSATSDGQLRELFTKALDDTRARYLLTYTPRSVGQPGWHALKVKLKSGGADITARRGYFVATL